MRDQIKTPYGIVEELIEEGWQFRAYSYSPARGWWVLPSGNDTVKAMRRGDPKPFYQGAVDTMTLYGECNDE
jgi:hypothetical protein